jgi:hypothetical protein
MSQYWVKSHYVGQRVEIVRADIKLLEHRIKKGKVFGRITRIDGEYHYVKPMWCDWEIELYRSEIK